MATSSFCRDPIMNTVHCSPPSDRPSSQIIRCATYTLVIVMAAVAISDVAVAQPGRGQGRGLRRGMSGEMREDMITLHALFAARDKISRSVKMLPNGAEAITESDDPKVAALLQEHVPAMEGRVHDDKPLPPMTFHPIFVELIKHANDYTLTHEETDRGMKAIYRSEKPFVIMLVQEHAKLVSRFVKNGMEEIHKPYTLPKVTAAETNGDTQTSTGEPKYINPAIAKYGKVVILPNASHPPRVGSKIVVDVTKGGEPSELNPAIEKVCRFVNIYAGAGGEPVTVDIAVVLHGDATLTILNAEAYSNRFKTKGNPNLDCLEELHKNGVRILVCGQSLIGKGTKPDEVIEIADVAVSALTSLVNLQADGYSYMPLGK